MPGPGKIMLVIGCMASGKSTTLHAQKSRLEQIGKTVLIVNHASDTRYKTGEMCTHDGRCCKCVSVSELLPLRETSEYATADVVTIDESQFFGDLAEFCRLAAEIDGKDVLAAGLSGGFKRQAFPSICELIPLADHVEYVKALCTICADGTTASFTLRKKEFRDDPNVVGGMDAYDAVCRTHYLEGC